MRRRSFLKLAAAAVASAAPPNIRFDTDGMLLVDGRREFLLGLYMLPNEPDPWKEAAGAGFNLALVEATREALDRAAAHGLHAWTQLGSIAPRQRAAGQERIRKIVSALKDHPALLYWETEDEPSWQYQKPGPRVAPSQIVETVRFAKTLDAAHPFYLNHAPTNLVSTLREYNEASDIVATDIYSVIPRGIRGQYALWDDGMQGDLSNTYISQAGQYADKMRQVAGPSRAVLMVLQAFAWEGLRKEGDRDSKMILYPTRAETRFMAFQSVVHGVNGLLWWGLKHTPEGAPFWADLKAVARELASLRAELAASAAKLEIDLDYHDTGHTLDRGIEWTARPSGKDVLLIAVNADRWPVEATLRPRNKFRRVTTLGESRPIRFTAGYWRDSLPAFGVRLYRLSP